MLLLWYLIHVQWAAAKQTYINVTFQWFVLLCLKQKIKCQDFFFLLASFLSLGSCLQSVPQLFNMDWQEWPISTHFPCIWVNWSAHPDRLTQLFIFIIFVSVCFFFYFIMLICYCLFFVFCLQNLLLFLKTCFPAKYVEEVFFQRFL